jgi:hypothetical protein
MSKLSQAYYSAAKHSSDKKREALKVFCLPAGAAQPSLFSLCLPLKVFPCFLNPAELNEAYILKRGPYIL